jgi:hypothetical protein
MCELSRRKDSLYYAKCPKKKEGVEIGVSPPVILPLGEEIIEDHIQGFAQLRVQGSVLF